MKNTFGTAVSVTLFGESHGAAIGAVLDGLAPGIPVDEEQIAACLSLRRPQDELSTARQEPDRFQIVSGVFEGKTTGTPLTVLIPNTDTRSRDYAATRALARPGHADYTAHCKYHGFEDYRGGGHFSGRITAALVAAGAIVRQALAARGITVGTHIRQCHGVEDRAFSSDPAVLAAAIDALSTRAFPVLDEAAGDAMRAEIRAARAEQNSVGGVLETAVLGVPAGVGEPWFDTVEGVLSHALFGIPAVKGVAFGSGFGFAGMTGKTANDPLRMQDGRVVTATNHNGGGNGGITNGMPLLFSCAVKPTPSIAAPQQTVDILRGEDAALSIHGRHDPAVLHRARIVVDCMTALVLADLLAGRFGTDWLRAD